MQATPAIKKWVIDTLNDHGFDASKLKVKLNELLPVAMVGEGRKSPEFWTGLYHVLGFEEYVCLYAYSQKDKQGKFYKSNIAASDMDPIDQPQEFLDVDAAQLIQQSRKEALQDPKFQKELANVQDFILKNKGKIDSPEPVVINEPEPTLTDFEEFNSDHQLSTDQNNMSVNETVFTGNSGHGAQIAQGETQELAIVVEDLVELFDVLSPEISPDHWVYWVYRGIDTFGYENIRIINRHVEFRNPNMGIEQPLKGSVLIKYFDSKDSDIPVYAIATYMEDGFYSETPFYISKENNFLIFSGELMEQDKWCFIANDFKSGLDIYRATGIKTIAAPRGVDIGFVFNEILTIAPGIKIKYFRNEKLNMREARIQSLKYDAQFNIGHIFIDRDFGTWGDYSDQYFNEYGADADSHFKVLLQEAMVEGNQFLDNLMKA